MALRVGLPEEINPSEDWCIPVYIPASPGYLVALRSVLTLLAHWYAWERDDLKRGKDAAYRWLLADQKTIAAIRAGKRCDDCGATNEISATACGVCGGAVIIESEEEMGQVVTDVTIEDGVLYVWFGPCCKQAVGNLATSLVDPPATPDDDDPPEFGGAEYTACAKAWALMDVCSGINDVLFEKANADANPFTATGAVQSAYPNINFGMTDLTAAYASAWTLANSSMEDDAKDPYMLQRMVCRWSQQFEDDELGLSSNEVDSARHHARAEGIDSHSLLVGDHWANLIDCIGKGDIKKITAYAIDDGRTCCETASFDWELVFDFTLDDQEWNMDAGEGDGYTPGLGWQSTGGGDCVFTQIDAGNVTGERSGTLVYAKLEGLLYATDPTCAEDSHALWFDGAGGAADIDNIIMYSELRSQAPGEFVVEKNISIPWSLGATATLKAYIQMRENLSAGELFAIQKLTLRGTGGKPVKDPVV